MKTRDSSFGRAAWCGILAAACCLASARAQDAFDMAYTWTSGGLEGWSGGGAGAALTNAGGCLRIQFAEQSFPSLITCVARYDLPASVRVTNLAFRLRSADIPASAVRMYLHSTSGEDWYVPLAVPAAGAWTPYTLPVEYAAGWTFGPRRTEAAFNSDLLDVAWVGVYVRRDASGRAQEVDVDDFRIQGLLIPQGLSIQGTISYAGEQAGNVRVEVEALTGAPTSGVAVTGAPGPFVIAGLRGLTDYRVTAFLDANGNAVRDFWEAYGEWSGNPARLIGAGISGANFGMTDPASRERLPYWWLRNHFNIPDSRAASDSQMADMDSDGDGMLNYAEFRAGTDPTNRASVFEIIIENKQDQTGPRLHWNAARGRTYSLWSTEDLGTGFTLRANGIPADWPINTYLDVGASNSAKRFYRVQVE